MAYKHYWFDQYFSETVVADKELSLRLFSLVFVRNGLQTEQSLDKWGTLGKVFLHYCSFRACCATIVTDIGFWLAYFTVITKQLLHFYRQERIKEKSWWEISFSIEQRLVRLDQTFRILRSPPWLIALLGTKIALCLPFFSLLAQSISGFRKDHSIIP